MPGPGNRKAKPKVSKVQSNRNTQVTQSNVAVDEYVGNVSQAASWNITVNIMCDVLELPDLTTRSGLKKVHANFDVIYQRIEKVYAKNSNDDKIKGAIVGIYAKMCVDSILRNKLIQRGLLDKVLPLLNIDSCRIVALRAFVTITHHGGVDIRVQVSKHSNVLTKLLKEHPDDPKVAELVITTISHSVIAALDGGETPTNPKVLKSLDMEDILRSVIETIKKPMTSTYAIDHAMDLLTTATLHASDAFKKYPPAIHLLVAGLRNKDWASRCSCLGALTRLHRIEGENDQRSLDPMKFMAAIGKGFPGHLSDILVDYGAPRCETYLTLEASHDCTQAMMTSAQDKDLYALGLKLANLILRTEFSIADGYFQSIHPVTGAPEIIDVGLPFQKWSDGLPHCARAIRQKGKKDEKDLADILDIKYHIMKQRIPEAVALAQKCIQRNPDCAYFYYAITLSADSVLGLRAAKQGLKCKITTPFVRFQMMQRAVEHAGDMGIRHMQDHPEAGDRKWEEGIAFLMSALEDAKTYVEQAPPDNRHMKNVSYWYILLTLTIKEAEISPDLRELQGAIDKLKIADEFSRFIGISPPKTYMRLAQETVVKAYPTAIKDFSEVISRISSGSGEPISPEKQEDDLAAWLEDMHMEGGEEEPKMHCAHPKVNTNNVELYRCSWCRNPSAILRKCSGCAKTRYCDSNCQKAHWSEHKKNCVIKPH